MIQLKEIYREMLSFYGSQGWWPSFNFKTNNFIYNKRNSLVEPNEKQKQIISIGAILTQNTSWQNAMKAIQSLNEKKMLSIKVLGEEKKERIAKTIKSAGYFNQKAVYLKEFSEYMKENYNAKLSVFFNSKDLIKLREELLNLKGIGFETADSILLYAGFKPIFMIDNYTLRLYERIYNEKFSYNKAQHYSMKSLSVKNLNKKVSLFNEMHALIVKHAQSYCLKKPLCSECFLKQKCITGKKAIKKKATK